MYYRPFWRPVLAGTFFAVSVFALSWYLMLGCHVGINGDGAIELGAGAAVWLWVTSCVAFFFGGMIASAMTSPPSDLMGLPSGSGWLKGAVIWGLSIPLALITYASVAHSGVLMALGLPHAGLSETGTGVISLSSAMGFYWSAFIALGLALIFSIVGSVSGCHANDTVERSVSVPVTTTTNP
jgi:hypothetical protein